MLTALLLGQWYGLSDPELKDALADRLSFRRFVGLPLDGGVTGLAAKVRPQCSQAKSCLARRPSAEPGIRA